MLGSSRESSAALSENVAGHSADAAFAGIGSELLSVGAVLAGESSLRATLSDSGTPASVRAGVLQDLFGAKLSALALEVVRAAVDLRWSSGRDLVDAIDEAGAQVLFTVAEREGRIDAVQDELFKFGRIVAGSGELQMVLTDPALDVDRKVALVAQLLEGKAQPETALLLEQVVANPRGRRVESAVEDLVALASIRRQRISAEVTSPVVLDTTQQTRLAAALGRIYGREVEVVVIVDPSVLGGVSVRVGDEVIDGTTVHRLEQARRRLVS
jgi:F-type H+-transporting ATPase subunit delta